MRGSKYDKCKYPRCDGSYTNNSGLGFCNKHTDLLEFIIWVLNNLEKKEALVEDKNNSIKIT